MLSGCVLTIECLILMLLTSSGIQGRPVAIILVLIGLFSIAYFFDLSISRRLRPVAFPLAAGYLLRLGLLLFDLYGQSIYTLPNSGADSEMFFKQGVQCSLGQIENPGAFVAVLGILFAWLGTSRLFVQFLLMLCSVASIHCAAIILDEAGVPTQQRRRTMYILCILPNFAILSSLFLRESIVTMLLALSVLCMVRWKQRGSEGWFLLAFLLSCCAAMFHSGSIAAAMGYILVRLFYDTRRGTIRFSWRNFLPALVLLLVFLYLFNNYGDVFFGKMIGLEGVEDIANTGSLGDSSYVAYVGNSDSLSSMLLYTPVRIAFFLFSPFPWQWRGMSDVIAFCFSSLFYAWVLVKTFCYLGRKKAENRELVIILLIVAFALLFVFAWGVSNTGTAVRHRDKAVVLYAVLLGITGPTDKRGHTLQRWRDSSG